MRSTRRPSMVAPPSPSTYPRRTASTDPTVRRPTTALTMTPVTRRRKSPTTASPASTSSAASRRSERPAWNAYLTDDKQYRLTRERQLVRQMQQLSAAHFHARASPVRQRFTNTSGDYNGQRFYDEHSLSSHSSGASSLSSDARVVRFKSAPASRHRMPGSPERLQGELAVLEHMLSDLEVETERLNDHEPITMDEYGENDNSEASISNPHKDADGDGDGDYGDREESLSVVYEDDDVDQGSLDESSDTDQALLDDPVATICYKSLRVGMDLTQKMHILTQKLDAERRHRKSQQRRIQELEELSLVAQARSDEVNARYDDLASQVDAMRDALIATEEALHRVSQDLIRSREPISFTTHFGDHTTADGYLAHVEDDAKSREDGARHTTRPASYYAQPTPINSDLIH